MTYCFERVPAGCVRASFAPRGQRCSVSAQMRGTVRRPRITQAPSSVCAAYVNGMSLINRVVRKVTSVEEQEAENYRYCRVSP